MAMKKSRKIPSLVVYLSLKDGTFTAVRRVLFVNRWLTKGIGPRGGALPHKTFLTAPPWTQRTSEEMSQCKIEGSR